MSSNTSSVFLRPVNRSHTDRFTSLIAPISIVTSICESPGRGGAIQSRRTVPNTSPEVAFSSVPRTRQTPTLRWSSRSVPNDSFLDVGIVSSRLMIAKTFMPARSLVDFGGRSGRKPAFSPSRGLPDAAFAGTPRSSLSNVPSRMDTAAGWAACSEDITEPASFFLITMPSVSGSRLSKTT